MKRFSLGLSAVLVAMPIVAMADPTLDFGMIAPTSGTISYAGGGAPLVGAGIDVDNVTGLNTPLHNNTGIPCASCFLNFTTGGLTFTDPAAWHFGAGGTITITGSVNGSANTTLLSGTFTDASVFALPIGGFKIAGGTFVNTVSPLLSSYFGTTAGGYAGGFNLSFIAPGLPPSAFTSSLLLSGDVTTSPTPEPVALSLLGTVVLGWGVSRYRRRKADAAVS